MEKILDEAAGLADDQTVLDRVKREQLFVKYLMIELHTYYCSKEELDRRMTEFKELVKQLGNVYNFAHWYEKGKSDPRSPHRIEAFYSRISCRYPARADQ